MLWQWPDTIKALGGGGADITELVVNFSTNAGSKHNFPIGPGVYTWFNDDRFVTIGPTTFLTQVVRNSGQGDVGTFLYEVDVSGPTVRQIDTTSNGFSDTPDDHNNGALLRLANGQILSGLAGHPSVGVYFESASSFENFAQWEDESGDFNEGATTYINLFELNGQIYNFSRSSTGGFSWYWIKRANLSSPWTSKTTWIDDSIGRRPYFHMVQTSANRVDFIITDGHPDDVTNNVYHGYFDATDDTFRDGSGAVVTLPADASAFTQIYDGSSTNAWVWDLVQHNGDLYGIISVFPNGSGDDHMYLRITNAGGSWTTEEILDGGTNIQTSEPHYSGGACLDPEDPDIAFAVEVELVRRVGRMYRMRRAGASDWRYDYFYDVEGYRANGREMTARPFFVSEPRRVITFCGNYDTFADYQTDIVAFDPDVPAHQNISARAWRLRHMINQDDPNALQLSEITFRDVSGNSINASLPGNAIASDERSGSFLASNAFDGVGGSGSRWAVSGSGNWYDQWIGWDAGAGNAFTFDSITVDGGPNADECFATAMVEFSNDGTTWEPYCLWPCRRPGYYFALRLANNTPETFPVSDERWMFTEEVLDGAYRFWRWDFIQAGPTDSATFVVQNIRLRNGSGTNLITSIGGTQRGVGDDIATTPIENAFDDTTSLFGGPNGRGAPISLIWDFGGGNEQQPVDTQIQARNSGTARAPAGVVVRCSNDGYDWRVVKCILDTEIPNGTTATYTFS